VQRGLSKSVKKVVVKNHLQGLNESENAKIASSSVSDPKLTTDEVDSVIKEFDSEVSKKGLDSVSKDYGVSNITKELSEIARFKRENEIEFSSIMEGSRIASTLKKFGAGLPEFEEFLDSVYARSLEKGYTPNEIISQSSKLQALEKKYGMGYDALRTSFDDLGKALSSKKKEKGDLESEIAQVSKKKSDLLVRHSLDEQKIQDYVNAKQQLSTFGFDIVDIQNVKNLLIALKNEKFEAKDILNKLNSFEDLQSQKAKIQQEVKKMREDLESNKKELEALEATSNQKLKALDEKYTKQKQDIEAYSELRALGVDGKRILAWDQIMRSANLDYGVVEGELRNQNNLKNLEDRTSAKIKELVAEEIKLTESISELRKEKENIETSIQTVKESALAGIEDLRSKILESIASLSSKAEVDLQESAHAGQKSIQDLRNSTEEQIKQVTQTVLSEVKSTTVELQSSTTEFSKELKDSISQASTEIKSVGLALEAGEKIGKYRNILPLLQLIDGNGTQDESEALIAMWNLSSRFNAWLENQYPGEKREISEPLTRLLESINNEIQRVGGA